MGLPVEMCRLLESIEDSWEDDRWCSISYDNVFFRQSLTLYKLSSINLCVCLYSDFLQSRMEELVFW